MLNNNFSKHFLFISFVIGIITFPMLAFADAEKIFKENSNAVVIVVTLNEKGEPISQGSGFVVRADGAIVTNYHVISNAKDIKIKAGKKVLDVEGLIYEDKENDLVILKVKGEKLPVVKIGDIEKVNVGEKVYVISSPEGLENTISDGLLSGIREITSDKKVLQITAPVSPGSSGGPVFNKDGEVIGIATFLIKEAQNLNFAMPVNLIKDKIEDKKFTALKENEIEDYKKTAEYWFLLGIAYSESGKYKEAIDAYRQATMTKPDYADAYNNLGVAYGESGMYKEEIDAYKQAININPDFAEAYSNLGFAYKKSGMHKDAIEVLKQAIRINPDYTNAHRGLGIVYHKLVMYKEAIEALKQAIRIEPDNAYVHLYLGILYSESKMDKQAIEAFKRAIIINPDYAEAHSVLGRAYGKLGMYKEAAEEYEQTVRIKPDDAEAHYSLGNIHVLSSKKKEAEESFKQAIKIKPDYAEAYMGIGLLYFTTDKHKETVEAFKQAIRIEPAYVDAHLFLGFTFLLLGDKGSALDEYKILKGLDLEKANELFNQIYQ